MTFSHFSAQSIAAITTHRDCCVPPNSRRSALSTSVDSVGSLDLLSYKRVPVGSGLLRLNASTAPLSRNKIDIEQDWRGYRDIKRTDHKDD